MSRTLHYVLRILSVAAILGLVLALAAPALAQDGTPSTVYTTRSVFMRAGPGMGWHIVATLPGGEQLSVLDQSSIWYHVRRADGTEGWVSGTYLTVNPPGSGGGGGGAGAALAPKPPSVGTLALVTTPVLNVRAGPGLNFAVVGTLPQGDPVAVLGASAQWRFITAAGGLQGWVNSIHLSSSITGPIPLDSIGTGSPAGSGGGGALPGGTLAIRSVQFDHAVRDSSRPGGAIVTMRVDFTGGTGPFAVMSDGFSKGTGLSPATRTEGTTTIGTVLFNEVSECGATMVHTVRLSSADGQSASQGYYVGFVNCPN